MSQVIGRDRLCNLSFISYVLHYAFKRSFSYCSIVVFVKGYSVSLLVVSIIRIVLFQLFYNDEVLHK